MAICRDRLLKQRHDILEQIANNPDADFKSKVEANHLAAEIAAAVLKFYTDGPGMLAARHAFPRTSLTGPGTTGVRLKLSSPLPYSVRKYKEEQEGEEERALG
jgi:hypothetical protein